MSQHEERFSGNRFNRPPAPHSSGDFHNRNYNHNKPRPSKTYTQATPESDTKSSGSSTNQANMKPAEVKTPAETNSTVKAEPSNANSQDKSSASQSPQKPSGNQINLPLVHDGKKKFTGRCRLFFGNIPLSLTDQEFINLIKPYGETEDLFLNAKKGFGFVKLETRAAAEACKNGLDGTEIQSRSLRVRYATHSAALQVKNLTQHCTNEALEEAFSIFGEVERAVVVVDDRGKSQGTGIVEFSRRVSFNKALDTITNGVFLISKSQRPVAVEPLDQKDEEDGLPEKYVTRNQEWMEEMSVGPRIAEIGSYEYDIGMKWKELDKIEADKKQELEEEMTQKRLEMELEVEALIHEHKTNMLRQEMMRRQAELNAMEAQRRQREEQKLQELEMRRMQLNQQSQRNNMGGAKAGPVGVANRMGGPGGANQISNSSPLMANRNNFPPGKKQGPGYGASEQELLMHQQQALRERQQQVFREMQQFKQAAGGQGGGPRPMIPPPQPPDHFKSESGERVSGALLANPERGGGGRPEGMGPGRTSRFDQPPAGMQGRGPQGGGGQGGPPPGMQQRQGAMANMQQQMNNQQSRMFAQGQGGMGQSDPKRPRRF